MERDIELTVRYAHAHMTEDAASIIVVTEHGRVTLRMHRFVLGNLAGTIARALWPREERPALDEVAPDTVATQPEPEQPEAEPDAIASSEAQDTAGQPEAPGSQAKHLGPSAGAQDHPAPQEPQEVLAAFDTVWPKADEPTAGVAPHDVPTQPEAAAPEETGAALTDAEPHDDVPTQPTLGEPDGDAVPSLAGAAPRDEPAGRAPPRRRTIRLTPRRKKP
jgi:hypothetical protein